MGSICQPLCAINISFLGLLFTPDFWIVGFLFQSPDALLTLRTLLQDESHMSASVNGKFFFLGFFNP
jgi:hypothetical protein